MEPCVALWSMATTACHDEARVACMWSWTVGLTLNGVTSSMTLYISTHAWCMLSRLEPRHCNVVAENNGVRQMLWPPPTTCQWYCSCWVPREMRLCDGDLCTGMDIIVQRRRGATQGVDIVPTKVNSLGGRVCQWGFPQCGSNSTFVPWGFPAQMVPHVEAAEEFTYGIGLAKIVLQNQTRHYSP